ncbi:MAG: threonine synthase [Candidatus Tectomicrobia bacterium]|uniref:Threonine synthase n=1 Tax=Tectimicrobiota bacterium TaxID=2528274 RepID=A0A932GLU6_UNCTE|nr:threonine synthase [Candidatus Tectomicrobia bacterium]
MSQEALARQPNRSSGDAPTYRAWFQCIAGCPGTYELNEIIYQCPKCGNLLEVAHDLDLLRQNSPGQWMALFDMRYRGTEWPYGSSVWGKKEMVCPNVDNRNIVSTYEGGSNLFWAERLGREIGLEDLWMKLCGNSHTGSFKDLGMTVLVSMVKQMISEGVPIQAVACASTGDTSASLAAYCAAAGIQAIVFLPRHKVSVPQLIQPLAHGALTLSLDTDFDGCMKLVQEICAKNNIYLANSMNSLRLEGQKTISIELVQQFDWDIPDVVIVPGGNLGNISAIGRGFLLLRNLGIISRLPRLVCAQAERANPLYRSYLTGFRKYKPIKAKKTLASAIQIGNPVSVQKAIKVLKEFDGIVEQATEEELANSAAHADRTGLYNCPHTGVALAVLSKLVKRGVIGPRDRVVVISTAHGLKFADFQLRYHSRRLRGIESRHSNLPVELPARADRIMETIVRRLEKP